MNGPQITQVKNRFVGGLEQRTYYSKNNEPQNPPVGGQVNDQVILNYEVGNFNIQRSLFNIGY